MDKQARMPIVEQSGALQKAFDWLNDELFGGTLPPTMLVLSRNNNIIGGYFTPKRWFDEDNNDVSEIAINANCLKSTGIVRAMIVLSHEMVHLWQYAFGAPSRAGYHNREWSDKAKEIGLQPFGPLGEEVGQTIDTLLVADGKAEKAIADMPEDYTLPWMTEPLPEIQGGGGGGAGGVIQRKVGGDGIEKKPGARVKYTCPSCGFNLWGKAGGNFECLDCNQLIIEMKGGSDA